jgi:hypothetical protein
MKQFILRIVDAYTWLIMFIRKVWLLTIIWYANTLWRRRHPVKYATTRNTENIRVDLTSFICVWYNTDHHLTLSSLYNFLQVGVNRKVLYPKVLSDDIIIVFEREHKVYHAILNLSEEEKEKSTNTYVSDLKLSTLPGTQVTF